jgi:hypothetical protein
VTLARGGDDGAAVKFPVEVGTSKFRKGAHEPATGLQEVPCEVYMRSHGIPPIRFDGRHWVTQIAYIDCHVAIRHSRE